MVYKGEYRRAIDADGRVELPEAMRQASGSTQYTITRGPEACLFLYPIKRWRDHEEKMAQLDDAQPEMRHFYRTVMPWAYDVETGEDGRIEIPTKLKEFAGLNQKVLILGCYTHVELWDPDQFDAYLDNLDERYDYDTEFKLMMTS